MKIYKDLINVRPINEEHRLKRIEGYRRDFSMWDEVESNFPERMYFFFVEYLKKYNNENICFFDIGAAEGWYARAALKYSKNSKVVCFEPEDERLEVLIENLQKYSEFGDLEIFQKIVASKTADSFHLKQYRTKDNTGLSSGSSTIVDVWDPYGFRRDSFMVPYESIKLDDLTENYDKIDIIKIDVEGGEIEVLKGSLELLSKHRPSIFLEAHVSPRFGSVTRDKIKQILNNLDFEYKWHLLDLHGGELEYYLLEAPEE